MEQQMNQPLFQDPIEEEPPAPLPEMAGLAADAPIPEPKLVEPSQPEETPFERHQREKREDVDAKVEKLRQQILDARKPETKPNVPQPVAPRILEQTRLEMELGANMNTKHDEARAKRPVPKPTQRELMAEGRNIPVFRPHTYQDEKGNTQGKQVRSGTL